MMIFGLKISLGLGGGGLSSGFSAGGCVIQHSLGCISKFFKKAYFSYLLIFSSNLFKLRKVSNSISEDTPKVEINFDLLF